MQPVSPQPLLSEEDYGAIEAAVMETARGRWFLAEYARRNRNADTAAVLAAIRRLERLVESSTSLDARNEVARGMASIAQAIAAAEIVAPAEAAPVVARHIASLAIAEMDNAALVAETPVAERRDEVAADVQTEPMVELLDDPVAEAPGEVAVCEPEASHEFVAEAVPEPAAVLAEAVSEVAPELTAEASVEPVADTQADIVAEAQAEPAVEAPQAPAAEMQAGAVADFEDVPVADEKPSDPGVRQEKAPLAANAAEPFPILELDEAAAEELLARDSQRPELKLPVNRLAASRRSRLDMASLLAVPREPPAEAPAAKSSPPGLVTFVDEEPVENGESVFSAPLRLEPEQPSAKETEAQTVVLSSSWTSRLPTGPRMTVAEIEAMRFKKKAALFS